MISPENLKPCHVIYLLSYDAMSDRNDINFAICNTFDNK